MSKWGEQAIKDVAGICDLSARDISEIIEEPRDWDNGELFAYAVAQREAVLELREALEKALIFVENEQQCREASFLPEPHGEEEGYLTEAQDTVDLIRAALERSK